MFPLRNAFAECLKHTSIFTEGFTGALACFCVGMWEITIKKQITGTTLARFHIPSVQQDRQAETARHISVWRIFCAPFGAQTLVE